MTVFRFTSEFSGTQLAVNVWHYETAGSANSTDANQAIVAVDTFFEAIKVFMAPGTWTHGTRVITVDETPNRVISSTNQSTTTTGTTNASRQAAAGVTWLTDFIGKSFQGRSFLGPLSQGGIDSNGLSISSSFITALQSAATTLMAPTASGAQLSVWSPKLGAANAVTGNIVRSGIHTQRRRLT